MCVCMCVYSLLLLLLLVNGHFSVLKKMKYFDVFRVTVNGEKIHNNYESLPKHVSLYIPRIEPSQWGGGGTPVKKHY